MSILSAGTSNTTSLVYTGDTTGAMVFQTNGTTEAMRIDTSQRVGIGITNPTNFLDVNTSISITENSVARANTDLTFYSRFSDNQRGYVTLKSESNSSGSSDLVVRSRNNFSEAEKFRIDSVGRVTMPLQPAFRATKTNGAGSSGTGVIVFNQINTNIGSCYNNSTGFFTAPVSGMYQLNFTGITNNASTDMTIEVNGTAVAWTYNIFSQTYSNLSMSVATYMSAGDYARINIKSGNMYDATDGGSARFSGFLIG
jgi:hypothetical protein